MTRAVVAFLTVASLVTTAAPAQERKEEPRRPKVVLVLSGGGARGSAHIGVIKKLEEYHVPVDMVIGTSMGSIIGGLYAAGWSIEEIEAKITTIDWTSVFVDKLPRQVRTFRRKTDDARFLVPVKMRFKKWKPYIPSAVIGGQNMELLFQGMEIDATGERDFDRFPIPYRAVATDLSTGEVVVLDRGSLSTAMRASMSVPGVFPPVEIDGKPLTDGGMAANFPVSVARSLGADVVIGVDITSPLRTKAELGNLLTRLDQMTSLLTNGNKAGDMAAVQPPDVIMVPELGDLSFSDFSRAKEAIEIGAAAAQAQESKLRALAVPDAEWAEFKARHRRRPPSDLVVDEVRITNKGPLADEIVARRIDVPLHEPLDESKLAPQLLRLYSLDVFGPIRHDFVKEDGKGVLTIEAPPKPYGRNSLQFGFNLTDDFRGDSGFNLSLSHLMNPVNRKAGEWRNLFQLGENALLGTQFYQPLDAGMKWFVAPELVVRRDKIRLYDEFGNALSEYRVGVRQGQFSVGRVFGNWGQLEVGAFRSHEDSHLKIGPAGAPDEISADDGGLLAVFRTDTLDSVTWPRDGNRARVQYRRSITSFGADASGDSVSAEFGMAGTIGKNIFYGSLEGAKSVSGTANLGNTYFLGGFLRLSGLAKNQLAGERGGLARLLYYRELTSFNLGSMAQRVYAGISLEGGTAYDAGEPLTWPSLHYAGSIYAGADTIVGPVYLGYGYEESGRSSFYLIIGQRF